MRVRVRIWDIAYCKRNGGDAQPTFAENDVGKPAIPWCRMRQ
jgi:hypothetical protein